MERAFAGPFCPMSKHWAVQSPSCRVNNATTMLFLQPAWPYHAHVHIRTFLTDVTELFKASIKNACRLILSVQLESQDDMTGWAGQTLFAPAKEWETYFCPWVSDRQTRRHGDVSGLRKEVRQLGAFTLHTKQVVSNSLGERRMYWCFCCQALREYRLQIVASDRPWQHSLSLTRSLMSGTPLYYGLVW